MFSDRLTSVKMAWYSGRSDRVREAMRKILERCPSCGDDLEVNGLHCPSCGTDVRGHFAPCPFCRLSPDQTTFLQLFVQSRGNLTEVEKILGVSYPTVRGKLDEVIALLGTPVVRPPRADRRTVLERIAAGDLSPEQGLAELRQADGEGKLHVS
jgi:hypothetical protein